MTTENKLPQFTIKNLLEAGVHFGHRSMRLNPKMSKYVYGVKNGISVIDLQKTAPMLFDVLKTVRNISRNNGKILFISTKKQASEAIAEAAKKCGQYYVNHRWLGGMLTNWKTVSKSIKTLRDIESQLDDDKIGLNKKEKLSLFRKKQKLELSLGGIKNMGGYPDIVFIVDIRREELAVLEAKKLGIPIIAIIDTNCNPDGITYKIPGNDDSTKAIKLYCKLISDAILVGMKENMSLAGLKVDKEANAKETKSKKQSDKLSKKTSGKESVKKDSAAKPPVKKNSPKKEVVKKEVSKKESAKKDSSRTAIVKKDNSKIPAKKELVKENVVKKDSVDSSE